MIHVRADLGRNTSIAAGGKPGLEEKVNMKLVRQTSIFIIAAWTIIMPVSAFTGAGWLPDYSSQLGIRASDAPAATEEFSQFETIIEDPLKFNELAETEVEAGAKVTIIHAGNMRWSTNVDGAPVNPAAFRVKVEGSDGLLTFLPDREKVELKLYRTPPFRSSSAPGRTTN